MGFQCHPLLRGHCSAAAAQGRIRPCSPRVPGSVPSALSPLRSRVPSWLLCGDPRSDTGCPAARCPLPARSGVTSLGDPFLVHFHVHPRTGPRSVPWPHPRCSPRPSRRQNQEPALGVSSTAPCPTAGHSQPCGDRPCRAAPPPGSHAATGPQLLLLGTVTLLPRSCAAQGVPHLQEKWHFGGGEPTPPRQSP